MIRFLLVLLILPLIAVFAAVSTVLTHPNVLRGPLSASAQHYAGLELQVGAIESHLNPLRFELREVQLRNPDIDQPQLLTLASLQLKLIQLPFTEKPFWDLHGQGIDLIVARDDNGRLNWISDKLSALSQNKDADTSTEGPLLPTDFSFNDITLENVSLTWREGDKEEKIVLPRLDAKRLKAANGQLNLALDYRQQQFDLEGQVLLFDPTKGILDYQLNIKHSDASLATQGRLILSPDLSGSEIDLDLKLSKLDQLLDLANTQAPTLPASRIRATLALTPDYHIRDLIVNSGRSELRGDITVNQQTQAVNAKLSSTLLDVDQLLPGATTAQAQRAPDSPEATQPAPEATIDWAWLEALDVTVEADINTLKAAGWRVQNLTLKTRLKQDIDADLRVSEVSQLGQDGQPLRRYKNLSVAGQLRPLATTTKQADLNAQLKLTQGDISLNAKGDINVNGVAGTQLALSGRAPRSADVWQLAELPWQEAGGVTLEGNIASDGKKHRATGKAKLGEQDLEFDLALLDEAVPRLNGSLALNKLNTDFLTPPPGSTAQTVTKPDNQDQAKSKQGNVLSDQALPLEALSQLNADLSITLNDIDTGYALLKKAKLDPKLENGKLVLQKSILEFDHGQATVSAQLNSKGNQPTLKARLKMDSDNYGKLGLEQAAGIRGGKGRVELKMDSKGHSPASLAANLNANINAKITDLKAKGNALNLIGSDLLSELISKLNPFAEKSESTDIECVAVHFKGQNGKLISDNGISLETDSTKIIGTGSVDLAEESLSFGVSPIARKGVGINLGAAAGLVRLAGTFSKPRIVADASGMFSSGLSTGAAIYTGGLSLLAQGLYKRAAYAGSACDGDLEAIPEAEALPEELLTPPPPTGGTTPSDGVQGDHTEAVPAQQ